MYQAIIWPYVHRVPRESIAAFGRWATDIMIRVYLRGFPKDALLAAAGFPFGEPMKEYWTERFMVAISPADLELFTTLLFPFIVEFRERVSQVWMCAHVTFIQQHRCTWHVLVYVTCCSPTCVSTV